MPKDIIQRAFELARSGEIQTVEGIRRRLRDEGYVVGRHLDGLGIRRQLKKLMVEAESKDDKAGDPQR